MTKQIRSPLALQMSKPLKERVSGKLLAVMLANLATYFALLNAESLTASGWRAALKEVGDLIPVAVALALMTVANGLLNPQMKARLVFWHWKHPLPGSRAFSVHANRDPRIDPVALQRLLGEIPSDEGEQNSAWYRMYKTVDSDDSVITAHKDYLFTKDYACLSVLMLVGLGGLGLMQMYNFWQVILYLGALAAQYLVVRFVAANYGRRFVTTVLALKSAGK